MEKTQYIRHDVKGFKGYHYFHYEEFVEFMSKTGLSWRLIGVGTGHLQVGPASNLDKWDTDEEAKVIEQLAQYGVRITRSLVSIDFSTYQVAPGRGFRIF